MTEITESRAETEQQNRQNLLKNLFNTVLERTLPLGEKSVPTYEGQLINGIFAADITIKSLSVRLDQRSTIPLIEIRSLNDKSATETLFINIEKLGIMLTVWKKRRKGFMPKYTYGLTMHGSGKEYQRFLNENHADDIDFSSTESIRELTNNIHHWKKV